MHLHFPRLTIITRHQEIANHINTHLSVTSHALTYGDGSVGSDRLRDALSAYMNTTAFRPLKPLQRSDVTILAGVSSVIDSLASCLCEPGQGILLGRPAYVGFISDLVNRARVKPVLVSFNRRSHASEASINPTSLEAVKCYEDALNDANLNGTPVRALLLCHPHNPFGTFYPPEAMEAYLRLCSKYDIHFIS